MTHTQSGNIEPKNDKLSRGNTALIAGGVLVGASLIGLQSYRFHSNQEKEARQAEAEALNSIEKKGSNVTVEDFTLVLNKGVNIRKHPHIMMRSHNDKSDENTVHEVKDQMRIKNPLSVRVDGITYYLIPNQDAELVDESGALNADGFNWVDGRVVGQVSTVTEKPYASIDYSETLEIPNNGALQFSAHGITYDADGKSFPVSQVSGN